MGWVAAAVVLVGAGVLVVALKSSERTTATGSATATATATSTSTATPTPDLDRNRTALGIRPGVVTPSDPLRQEHDGAACATEALVVGTPGRVPAAADHAAPSGPHATQAGEQQRPLQALRLGANADASDVPSSWLSRFRWPQRSRSRTTRLRPGAERGPDRTQGARQVRGRIAASARVAPSRRPAQDAAPTLPTARSTSASSSMPRSIGSRLATAPAWRATRSSGCRRREAERPREEDASAHHPARSGVAPERGGRARRDGAGHNLLRECGLPTDPGSHTGSSSGPKGTRTRRPA